MDRVPALEEPLKKLLGGPTAKVMAEHLDLHTVGDLLHHYPRRYEERGQLTKLAELPLDEDVTVVAQVADARVHTFNSGRGQRLEITITDGSGRLQLVFFGRGIHKPHKELLPGSRAMFAGKVSVFNRTLQLAHPTYAKLGADAADEAEDGGHRPRWAGALIPIYPACKGLESWKIAKAVDAVLPSAQEAVDPLPASPARRPRLRRRCPRRCSRSTGPQTKADIEDARERLKWDEAFVLQVALARRRFADAQLPAVARKPARRRPARRLRRQAALHPHRGPAEGLRGDLRRPRHRTPHAPAAPGRGRLAARRWSRCARCSPSSTRAGRRRCWRPPRSSPSSTTAPSPR